MPFGIYDTDGTVRLTLAPNSGFCGLYAPDGSIYYTEVTAGSTFYGSLAANGSLNVINATGSTTIGRYDPNGSIRVTTLNENNGALRVSGFSLTPIVSVNWLTTPSVPAWLSFNRADATTRATYFNSSGNLTTVTSATDPRFDYDRPTLNPQGLLIEPAFTNLILQSNYSASWTTSRATITANNTSGITGTNTAGTFIEDATASNTHVSSSTVTFAAGSTYIIGSVFKAKGRDWVALRFPASAFTSALTAYFDLQNGVVGSVTSPATSGIVNLGGGWYYCWTKATATASIAASAQVFIASADGAVIYNGDNTSGIYISHAQCGIATLRPSIVNTAGASVARAADVLSQVTYGANAQIWQRKDFVTGTVDRIYYDPGSAPVTLPTGYWYQGAAVYSRALTAPEQIAKLVVNSAY